VESGRSSQTITFLFTDLEKSTRLWEQFPQAMQTALERHDQILRAAVESSNGWVVKSTGDGLMAAFATSLDGLKACLKAQQDLLNEPWGEVGPLRVRMGLHAGEAQPRGADYYGPAVNRAARLMAAAHGGQVLLSESAASLVMDLLPEGAELRDLGDHRLKDLERPERIFQLIHPGLMADFPPLATLSSRPNNLPTQPTELIGREVELVEIKSLLDTAGVRLLTLTGPGGTGKTRLALQAAAELIDRFNDGVFFVDLAPARDLETVLTSIARVVGIRENSERSLLEELTLQLEAKSMLLLLDNFEQVTSIAPKISELIHSCPDLKALVTSREALHVRGEQVYPVPPLSLPDAGLKQQSVEQLARVGAVQLFLERAQEVKSGFKLTEENAQAVAEICLRLDGLPLAIELAAARLSLFSPQALLERLESRLALLKGGARDLPARQQTLRDTIGWSYDLLTPMEQQLFELLSVFSGFTLEAIERVAAETNRLEELEVDVLDGLASLSDKSLVRQIDHAASAPRFTMLETIREFALERLSKDPDFKQAAKQAHAGYYAGLAQGRWQLLNGDARELALAELELEIENIRTAWRYWVKEGNLEQLGKLTDSLWLLYDARGWYYAAVELTTGLLQVLSSTPSTPERLEQEIVLQIALARTLLAIKGYTSEAEAAYTRALQLSRREEGIPQRLPVLKGLYSYYIYRAEFEKAIQIGEQILSMAERTKDANIRAEGYFVLGTNVGFTRDLKKGYEYLEKAFAGFDPNQQPVSPFRFGINLGVGILMTSAMFQLMLGFPDHSLQLANQGAALAKKLDHPYSMAYSLFHWGYLHLLRREVDQARRRAQAVIHIAEEHEFQIWRAVGLSLSGAALAGMGREEEGRAQLIQGMEIYQQLKSPPVFWPMLLVMRARVEGRLGNPHDAISLLDQAIEIVEPHSEIILTDVYRLKGEILLGYSPEILAGNVAESKAQAKDLAQTETLAQAEVLLLQSLQIAQNMQSPMFELLAAVSLCQLWRAQGKAEPARQLLGGVLSKFTEGFDTADLQGAVALLKNLS
jgi:predicted ATPase/class 3 adenylate cyclase